MTLFVAPDIIDTGQRPTPLVIEWQRSWDGDLKFNVVCINCRARVRVISITGTGSADSIARFFGAALTEAQNAHPTCGEAHP